MNIYERENFSPCRNSPEKAVSVPLLERYPQLSFREKLALLTLEFLNENQVECPVEHVFEGETYIRIMRIPRDTLFIGRPHRYGHRCELREGNLIHITPMTRVALSAPFALVTQPGYQVVVYTLSDVVGATVHPNPTGIRDVEALEADIFESLESMKELGVRVREALLEDHT
jgi:hypothetical protein